MKKQVSPAVIAIVVVILLAIVGGVGYKMFGPQHLPDIKDEDMKKKYFPNGYPYGKNELKQPASDANATR